MSNRKMGFWTVTSIVVGGQIGSGVFLLPANLAIFGNYGLWCWIFTGIGAIFLSLVFAGLCARIPKTGGPHTYIEEVFGRKMGFFGAWGYWLACWISVPAVAIGAVSTIVILTPWAGNNFFNLIVELFVMGSMAYINLRGVYTAGIAEFIFTILKVVPLFAIPLLALPTVDMGSTMSSFASEMDPIEAMTGASILATWGFLGLEAATTPAGSISQPHKTIPRALILGTIIVAVIYMLGTYSVMGNIDNAVLKDLNSPYAYLTKNLFGHKWEFLISIAIIIVCLGTLQATILTSSQISYGAALDKLFPSIFADKNKHGAPKWSIILPVAFICLIFILLHDVNLLTQFSMVIEMATVGYLSIYVVCSLCYMILLYREPRSASNIAGILVAICALLFSMFILVNVDIMTIVYFAMALLLGVPFLWYQKKRA